MTIKELRERVQMTQSIFAAHLGIPVRTLQNWECGHRTPPLYIVQLIGRLLQLEQLAAQSAAPRETPALEDPASKPMHRA